MDTKKLLAVFALAALFTLGGCTTATYFSTLPKDQDQQPQSGDVMRDSFTQTFAFAKYDLLWVIDNSGSMADEADYVRDSITTFVQNTQSRRIIDYQMAVINTDWFDTVYGHGQLRGPTPVIKSTSANPITDFQNAINDIHMCGRQPCSSSTGFEMGLNSARQAITDYGASFIRDQSNLLVIVVSDEQDSSCTPIPGDTLHRCDAGGSQAEGNAQWNYTPPSEFVSFFQGVKATGTGDTAYFPIVGKNRADCTSFASLGSRYLDVLTGYGKGQSGSICQDDMQTSLDRVANSVADNGICFPLRSLPNEETITLFVDEVAQSSGYQYDNNSNSLCFNIASIPANGSRIEITYVVR